MTIILANDTELERIDLRLVSEEYGHTIWNLQNIYAYF